MNVSLEARFTPAKLALSKTDTGEVPLATVCFLWLFLPVVPFGGVSLFLRRVPKFPCSLPFTFQSLFSGKTLENLIQKLSNK